MELKALLEIKLGQLLNIAWSPGHLKNFKIVLREAEGVGHMSQNIN